MDWQKKSYSLSAGSRTLKWVYSKDSSGYSGEDCGWVDGLTVGTGSFVGQPDAMSEALDSHLKFTESGGQGWWIASGESDEYYYEADAAQSDYDLPDNGGETCLQAIVDTASSQTVKFYWKVSSEQSHDYLQFYIDSTLKDQISGEVGWQQKSYPVDAGIHILKWRYVKDGSGQSGDDCGWVDFVQWTGPSPTQDPANWQEIAYKHDLAGHRIEKMVDSYSTRYAYDGDHVIAEYDGNNNLMRKYIYGPGIDQPVSMTEVADANATYYYHFDALGSVVALSNASGDTVQTYEYSVYGEVAVEDPNHTNPYMFAGVRYDIEIGLYYNRARCYNPFMGRFLQTDPIGYEDGINWYLYCANNPVHLADPTGQFKAIFRGYSEQQIQDVMSGITAICEACEQRVREINQTLGSLNCTAHTPGGPECKRRPALEEARIRLRKIRDLIKSDDNTTIIFRLKNWGDTPVGGEIERLWAPSDDLTGEQRVRLTINSGDYGPWGDKDPSGHADPTLMGELLLHELSHLFGTEDTEEIDWGNAFKFDDFFISPIYKTQYYMVLEAECFKKPEED